ncbi:uncharacterized protein EV420DRAFT_844307 [Desarmillaria tabescens]|uniref:F-box domain-containing protein n=1 Tax=Armillaria tabescens TaxID=1929756 RepID=A0AA39JT59_ARMTA|nr:uncharacterized protein EV420DRAFT_844307 [Desarmillaria tabescens]KAK0448465.1 hypothetical protein EV420DRAFT_844307 [Desarmillaria tabescens]
MFEPSSFKSRCYISPAYTHSGMQRCNPLESSMVKLKIASRILRRWSSSPSSPIYRLPPELLIEIFLHATLEPKRRDVWRVRAKNPLVISHVCGVWRDIAIDCSPLWSCIAIQQSSAVITPATRRARHLHDSFNDTRVNFPLTKLYLQRSRKLPIDVEIIVRQPPSPQDWWTCSYAHVLSDLLLPHVGRFRSLMMNHQSWVCHRILWERILTVSMPILEDLEFYSFSPADTEDVSTDRLLASPKAELCPSLKELTISIPCQWQEFGFSNLTSLSFAMLPLHHCPTIQELVEILRLSKDTLDKVEIIGAFAARNSESPVSPSDRLLLPNVRMLRLGFHNARDVRPFLYHVAFPALKALVIINMHGENAFQGRTHEVHTHSINRLFDAMIRLLPLSQLTFLILRHVEFREERFPAWSSVQRGYTGEKHLPVSWKFMASLTSLRHLFLISPDNATLTSMNYPIPLISQSETEDSLSRLPLVLPHLSVLRINSLSPKSYHQVLDWIVQRHSVLRAALGEYYRDGPFLRTLRLCLPEDAQVTMDALGYPGLAYEETISYFPDIHRMKYPVMHDNI